MCSQKQRYVLLAAFLLATSCHGQSLWGDLPAGPHPVGFRTIFRFDPSRNWQKTRDYTGKFSPDPHGRPVQTNVWYPAYSVATRKAMAFRDYIDQTSPAAFSTLSAIMQQRSREDAGSAVPPASLPQLLLAQMAAYADSPAAPGRFPLVLYFSGLNGAINSNVILFEFLASHGYVVASISLLGLSDEEPSQARTPADLEAALRDMEFALAFLSEESNTDRTKIATIGHSVGAVEAALFAMRNGNVSAIVGLDGTYGFRGSGEVLTGHYGYSPANIRAPLLDLRRAQGDQDADLDLTPVHSLRHADRTLGTLPKMHHSDSTSFAMVAHKFEVPIRPIYANTGWDRDTARRGYQHSCRIVLAFLNDKTKGEPGARAKLGEAVQREVGSQVRHFDAEPAAPSPSEAVALANQAGMVAAQVAVTKICAPQPATACVPANLFNSYGYHLLGQQRGKDAVIAFEMAAWAHPTSANAQDSLADGYLAMGDKAKARTAIRRSIELAPADSTIPPEAKPSFIAGQSRRLEQVP